MNLAAALVLGVVEGLTEFLPVSSTGHLTIVEKLLGLRTDSAGVTAFTAIIQVGAIVAVIVYFAKDIARLIRGWVLGLVSPAARAEPEYRLAWLVIIGTIPIGIVGFLGRHLITGTLRSVWVVVAGLLLWSIVMWVAERSARQRRSLQDMTVLDAVLIGLMQCVALVPGVSRSGATISGGLFRGLDRVSATRFSFFLAIPALLAAGAFESVSAAHQIASTVGWAATGLATAVSFVVALASIAFLLRLVAHHRISVFNGYRVLVAVLVAGLLLAGVITPD